MELDDLKKEWTALSATVQTQKLLTTQLIKEMTQVRYTQKFTKLTRIESLGAVVCFIAALLLLKNLAIFNTWYLFASALLVIAYLILLPLFTLKSLYALKNINIHRRSFKETVYTYTQQKQRLLLIQRVGLVLNFFILLLGIPVAQMLFKGNDLYRDFTAMESWELKLGALLVFGLGLAYFSRWGYRCYKSITHNAEEILNELKD